jgi:lipid-A-disaccharide synthase
MIVTGEASGDLHGANLVRAMKAKEANLSFVGMGGEEMAAAGVDLLFDAAKVSVVGVAEVFSHLADIIRAQLVLRKNLARLRPDLLIIIDLPDFNLMLAGYAKKLGIPVFYYICPQVWAWRSGRVKTIRKRVDTVGVILPFEERFLRQRGVLATYVGHPLLDTVSLSMAQPFFRERYSIPATERCVGLLPGSRRGEVAALLPVFLEAAEQLQRRCNERLTFLLPLASTISEADLLAQGLERAMSTLQIRIIRRDRYDLMAACSCVVAASGTVTLELALLNIPMVVVYKLAPLTYQLGRLLIKLEFFSLVNLIAGKEVVPELLQDEVRADTIAELLERYLFDQPRRAEVLAGLAQVRQLLGTSGASARAAQLAFGTIHRVRHE